MDEPMTKERFLALLPFSLPAENCAAYLRNLDALLDAARRDEREACRQAVLKERLEEGLDYPETYGEDAYNQAIADAAGAIRARLIISDRPLTEAEYQKGAELEQEVEAIRARGGATKPLPTPADLRGSDPDFTGGVETVEYLRGTRDGD